MSMHSVISIIFLGIIQGLTEFLPVSSSGHLVVAQHFLKIKDSGATLELLMHAGTLFSILIFFRKRILKMLTEDFMPGKQTANSSEYLSLKILASTFITGTAAYLLKDRIEPIFDRPILVCLFWILMGLALLFTFFCKGAGAKRIGWVHAVVFGFIQIFALLPGISRSGITITALILMGRARKEAFEFSFLASVPLLTAALLLGFEDMAALSRIGMPGISAALLSSFLTGCIALWFLAKHKVQQGWHHFGFYCLFLGIFIGTILFKGS